MQQWPLVLLAASAIIALKSTGPLLLGRRDLPAHIRRVLALSVPATLTAVILTQTFALDHTLRIDARAGGAVIAVLGVYVRLPLVAVLVLAALATAALRYVFGRGALFG